PPRIPELEDHLDRAGLGGIQDHGGAQGIQGHPELGTKQGGRAGSDCRTHGFVPGLEATNHRAIDPDGTACSGLAEPSSDAKRSEVVSRNACTNSAARGLPGIPPYGRSPWPRRAQSTTLISRLSGGCCADTTS